MSEEEYQPSKFPFMSQLRLFSLLDGISYLLLVGGAVPLKYIGGNEIGVKILGPIHGGLFVLLCIWLWIALTNDRLSFKWCVIVFVCALFPFAPFFLDRKLKNLGLNASDPESSD